MTTPRSNCAAEPIAPGAGPDSAQAAFEALLGRAHDDPAVLAFWLGGSRGRGWATPHSDYDCTVIMADDAAKSVRREVEACRRPGLDLIVMTLAEFELYATWGSPEAWDRCSFGRLKALVDKTGKAQPLIDSKGLVPAGEIPAFIHASLDHALNQAYRGLKCLRDGDPAASRLEAAAGVNPFLDAVFALHGGRLRPYAKYLRWELETFPLERLPLGDAAPVERLLSVLTPSGATELCQLLADAQSVFRSNGHGGAYDGWGEALPWILAGDPSPA